MFKQHLLKAKHLQKIALYGAMHSTKSLTSSIVDIKGAGFK